MTGLVDQAAAKTKTPADGANGRHQFHLGETGLFAHFTKGGVGERLARLHMSLGESPVPVHVANEQHQRTFAIVTEHDAPGMGKTVFAG